MSEFTTIKTNDDLQNFFGVKITFKRNRRTGEYEDFQFV